MKFNTRSVLSLFTLSIIAIKFEAQAQNASFTVDPKRSSMQVSGNMLRSYLAPGPLIQQESDSLTTSLSGTISATTGALYSNKAIKIESANVILNSTRSYLPPNEGKDNPGLANFGGLLNLNSTSKAYIAFRDLAFNLYSFDMMNERDINASNVMFNPSRGTMEYFVPATGAFGKTFLVGMGSGNQNPGASYRYSRGVETLILAMQLPTQISGTSSITYSGTITATRFVKPQGDCTGDYRVDGADLLLWQKNNGKSAINGKIQCDADQNGIVDIKDANLIQSEFGVSVPRNGDFDTDIIPSLSVPLKE